jgi:pimeloyl-ACP methyl ester carboxylesterase
MRAEFTGKWTIVSAGVRKSLLSGRSYRIVKPDQENSDKLPLLCIHGGTGVPHDYLEPLEAIATTERRVVFYDQLGCENSDRPTDSQFIFHRLVQRRTLFLNRFEAHPDGSISYS